MNILGFTMTLLIGSVLYTQVIYGEMKRAGANNRVLFLMYIVTLQAVNVLALVLITIWRLR